MPQSQSEVEHLKTVNVLDKLPDLPVLSSKSKGWNGIVVEYRHHPANELASPPRSQHLITLNCGITVNTVTPGIVLSGGTEKWIEENAQKFGWGTDIAAIEQKILEQWLPNPTGRIGRPMDIATLVAYLASPLSGYINGANLRVDGGSTVSIN